LQEFNLIIKKQLIIYMQLISIMNQK